MKLPLTDEQLLRFGLDAQLVAVPRGHWRRCLNSDERPSLKRWPWKGMDDVAARDESLRLAQEAFDVERRRAIERYQRYARELLLALTEATRP